MHTGIRSAADNTVTSGSKSHHVKLAIKHGNKGMQLELI